MDAGCYGRLRSVIPPITVPAWMCMATSSLGVYGFRNRLDRSYGGLGLVDSQSVAGLIVWGQIAREGGKSVVIGVPPGYPPRRINGISVGCFLTPNTAQGGLRSPPPGAAAEIAQLVGHYPFDVKNFRTHDKARLRDEIYANRHS